MNKRKETIKGALIMGGVVLGAAAFILVVLLGSWSAYKGVQRYQRNADAHNQIRVTEQQASAARAQIEVIQAEAEQRYQESVGIRRAQDEIAKTLTPLYVQHEAIEAQLEMARSQNHTVIWAPSGANGVPLVSTVDLQRLAEAPPAE